MCEGNRRSFLCAYALVFCFCLIIPNTALSAQFEGSWHGYWSSAAYPDDRGTVTGSVSQYGSFVSGTFIMYNTLCGPSTTVYASGSASGNSVALKGYPYCSAIGRSMTVEVQLIAGAMGDVLVGYYQSLIGSQVNDAGIITLSKGTGSEAVNLSGNWHGYWASSAELGQIGSIELTANQIGASVSGSLSGHTSSCGDIGAVPVTGTVNGRTAFLSSTFLCSPLAQNLTIHIQIGIDSTNKISLGGYLLVEGGSVVDFGIVTGVRGLSGGNGSFSGAFEGTWASAATLGVSGSASGFMSQGGNNVTGSLDIMGTDCGDLQGVALAGTVTGRRSSSSGTYYCPQVLQNISFDLLLSLSDSGDIVTGIYQNKLGLTTVDVGFTEGKITAYQSVSADFSAIPLSGVAPLSVTFTDLSSGGILNRSWNFGDGGTSTIQNPTHVYQSPGTYTVSLNVSGPAGSNTETKIAYINVTPPPQPPIAGFSGTPITGFAPLSVSFKDESIGSVSSWAWDFGGGSPGFSNQANSSNTYSFPGNYSVTLTVTGPGGSNSLSRSSYIVVYDPTPVANFGAIPLSGISPLRVQFSNLSTGNLTNYQWLFGDGEGSAVKDPLHTYTVPGNYTVSLTALGPTLSDTETKTNYITVNYPHPVAGFSMEPSQGEAPLTVQFADESGGEISGRQWQFGDDQTEADKANTMHTYNDIGRYNVSLQVTGPGGSSIAKRTVYIYQVSYVNKADETCAGNLPCFISINDAVSVAPSTALIKVAGGDYREDIILSNDRIILIEGGYQNDYMSRPLVTSVNQLALLSGLVIPDRITLAASPPAAATYVPVESPHKSAYYRYKTPPPGFKAVVGWMQAVDIEGKGSPSKVEVDWMRIHATVNGRDYLLQEDNFDVSTEAMQWYGLYTRNPWVAGEPVCSMPFEILNSALVIHPGDSPLRVFHWWNTSRALVPEGALRVWFDARVRIMGGAGVQAGIDYWKDETIGYGGPDVNNTEAGASDWYGNGSSDWQIISVGIP